ncbi:MAG: type I glyceraldehyde-3-phosphate dehydrogenase [Nanoarchaeota archaeon]|nr:type I glyceraldehyde-3-phosphate dehydrogenase [Nanoarchaeota archaeon]
MINVAINGFGRIGRMILKAGLESKNIKVVAINDLTPIETLAYLLKHDSVHGRYNKKVSFKGKNLVISGKTIPVYAEKDPAKLPWKKHKVDIIAECTGRFTKLKDAKLHLKAGAKKVLISAPGKDGCPTYVYGVNHKEYKGEKVISNGSCTTNCLAPLAKLLSNKVGIASGFLNTIHAYTATQNLVDGPNKKMRRCRAAAQNIVPTSTGAAVAVTKVVPELKGKMDGLAMRVPVVDGSVIDFTFIAKKKTSVKEINKIIKQAAQKELKGVIEYSTEELVSTDILTNPHSAIFDSKLTDVHDNLVRIIAWYDNEWGFSCRMVDMFKVMAKK